jgi:ribosomal-protein-alanine N-acetyltransferase
MTIRKAVSGDVSKLFELEQELFQAENYPLSRASFFYHVKNNLLYIAEVEGIIAGYVLALVKRKDAKLYSIGVAKAYRGRKIAYKLLEVIIAELLAMDFKQIVLEVRTDNQNAVTLYENFGFKVKKIVKSFYRDGCDAYLMAFKVRDKN